MRSLQSEAISRTRSVKILSVGNYVVLFLSIIEGLAFVPLYLIHIGDHLYGIWLGTGGFISLLAFFDMGIATLAIQRIAFAFGRRDYRSIGIYFFNGLLIQSLLFSVLLITGFFVSGYLPEFFDLSDVRNAVLLRNAFLVALVALTLTLTNNAVEGTINALQRPLFGKLAQIFGTLVGLIATYVLLINGYSLLSISYGLLLRICITLILNFIFVLRLFKCSSIRLFQLDRLAMLDYGKLLPALAMSKLGSSLVANIEPTLIAKFISPQMAVYYTITKKAGGLIRSIFDRVGGIVYPSFAHIYSSDGLIRYRRIILIFSKVYTVVLACSFGLFVVTDLYFVSIWVGPENYLGDGIAALIAGSLFLGILTNSTSYLLSTAGDIAYPSKMVFFESLLRITLQFLCLYVLGVAGLPVAGIAGGVIFIMVYLRRWKLILSFPESEYSKSMRTIAYSIGQISISTAIAYVFLRSFATDSTPLLVIIVFFLLASYTAIFRHIGGFHQFRIFMKS